MFRGLSYRFSIWAVQVSVGASEEAWYDLHSTPSCTESLHSARMPCDMHGSQQSRVKSSGFRSKP